MKCRRCFGTGVRFWPLDTRYWPGADGKLISRPCEACGGTGEVHKRG